MVWCGREGVWFLSGAQCRVDCRVSTFDTCIQWGKLGLGFCLNFDFMVTHLYGNTCRCFSH